MNTYDLDKYDPCEATENEKIINNFIDVLNIGINDKDFFITVVRQKVNDKIKIGLVKSSLHKDKLMEGCKIVGIDLPYPIIFFNDKHEEIIDVFEQVYEMKEFI